MDVCDECGMVFRFTTLENANEYGDLCPVCYARWLDGTIDEELEDETL